MIYGKSRCRRIFAALILISFIVAVLPVCAYARSTAVLDANIDAKLDGMGDEAFDWHLCLCAICIPVLICRYASYGFQLLGNTFMTKGEYSLDKIKRDIFYSTVAVAALALLPQLLGWSMDLFKRNKWLPPAPSYHSGTIFGGVFRL